IDYRKCQASQILKEHGMDKVIPLPELVCTMFHISGLSPQAEV
nr:RecName: Full=Alpha-lactalbumin I; AltName: Full=Lactose synthase B protein [Macropus giganteus]